MRKREENNICDINSPSNLEKGKKRKLITYAARGICAAILFCTGLYLILHIDPDSDPVVGVDYNYPVKWMRSATKDELLDEREKVRQAYCSSGSDFELAERLERLLWLFDKELRTRNPSINNSPTVGFQREHGWYLSNDD